MFRRKLLESELGFAPGAATSREFSDMSDVFCSRDLTLKFDRTVTYETLSFEFNTRAIAVTHAAFLR